MEPVVVNIQVQSTLQWQVMQGASPKRWIAVCDPMNLAVEADSLPELQSVIGETIHLTFVDLLLDNELDSFLRAKGWTARGIPAQAKTQNDVVFNVPWELIMANARDSERRAY